MASLANRIRQQKTPLDRKLYRLCKALVRLDAPVCLPLHRNLYLLHVIISSVLSNIARALYWTPLFRSQIGGTNRHLHIAGGGMPYLSGPIDIEMGDYCRLSSALSISGRRASRTRPTLKIGNNVGIGWQTTIAVGTRVILEDNVRIAGRAFLAGYPGHPIDPAERAAGLPDHDSQVGDIILRKDVWLATGCTISSGVEIGEGTIVAAGSVVTRSLPPHVLAAGAPAKIVRNISPGEEPKLQSASVVRIVQ